MDGVLNGPVDTAEQRLSAEAPECSPEEGREKTRECVNSIHTTEKELQSPEHLVTSRVQGGCTAGVQDRFRKIY